MNQKMAKRLRKLAKFEMSANAETIERELVLAQAYSWNVSYAVMACLMGVGMVGVLAAPRERHSA